MKKLMKKPITMAQLARDGRAANPIASIPTPTVPPPAAPVSAPELVATLTDAEADEGIAWCVTYSPERPTGTHSGRNNWLFRLACSCNRKGIPQAYVLKRALAHWQEPDFTAKEIGTAIANAYQCEAEYNTQPFVPRQRRTSAPPVTSAAAPPLVPPVPPTTDEEVAADGPPADGPPAFPRAMYNTLPNFLLRACHPCWELGRELDVLLMALLVVLSGVFPNVGGTHGRRRMGLGLFGFIAAPAASGKGLMGWAERLVRVPHRQRVEASRRARAQHEAELAEWQRQKRPGEAPAAPADQRLLFPADTSGAALTQLLADNDGCGIICESEADALTQANAREWGNFSTTLRKAFHHEPISVARKGPGSTEIPHPALAVLLTGTPQQVQRLMLDVENGLVSRFLFYTYTSEVVWRDMFDDGPSLDAYYDELGQELATMMALVGEDVEVRLTPGQRQQHFAAFGAWTAATPTDQPERHSSLHRLGLSAFRLAMLLTVLRCFEHGEEVAGMLVCTDEDFATAMTLIDVFRQHTDHVLTSLVPPAGPARGAANDRDIQQAQARKLQQDGLSLREIEQQLGVPRSTLSRWFRAANEGGATSASC